jgi:soluble cytochrome b562
MPALRFAAVSLAAVIFFAGAAFGQTKPAAAVAGIEAVMEDLEGALEVLSRQVKDPAKRDANLALLSRMQHDVLMCKQQTPEAVRKLEGEAKTKLLHTYRSMMIKLLRQLLLAEEHLIAGNHEEAARAVEELEKIEEAGHKALGVEGH